MNLRLLNLSLLIVALLLSLNVFFPIGFTTYSVKDDLSCFIDGNELEDLNRCCYEIQRLDCSEGCDEIDFDDDVLKYCEKSGYYVG